MDDRNKTALKNGKRTKSATKYPKQLPSYIVAFTFQESLNDLNKCQEILDQNENDNASIKTISSNNFVNCTSIIKNITQELDTNEVKIDILDEKQYAQVETKSPKIDINKLVDDKADEQPQVLYEASKKRKLTKKQPKKNKHVIKIKNVHFKLKHPQNTISRRLVKYNGKTKKKSINPYSKDIQKQFYSNEISTVVAHSQILKRASAKENLLSEANRIFLNEIKNFNKNETASIASSPSSTTNSFKSFTSQKTLMPESSICSSQNEDFFGLETMNSAIQLAPDVKTFKDDVVNIALAVTCEPAKKPSCTKIVIDDDTRPTEKSSSPANDTPNIYETETVITTTSDGGTYCASCTSSNFNKLNIYSDLTLMNESQSSNENYCQNVFGQTRQNIVTVETNLLNNVKNIEKYDIAPSTSNGLSFDKINDVLIAETGKTDVSYAKKSARKNWSKNIYKNINLPNDAKIRAELTENAKRRTDAEPNINTSDMWERLTVVMELAVKRLEESLSEKIVTELKKTLSIFKQHTSQIVSPTTSHSKPETVIHITAENNTSHKTIVIEDDNLGNKNKYFTVQCVQCDLVQNHVIDRIMLNLSVGDIKAFPSISFQKKKVPLSKSYHKTSKPFQSVLAHVGKGDTIAVATTTSSFAIKNTKLHNFLSLFSRPLTFVRENLFIFVSVPIFFIILICLYEFLVLVIKLW